MRYSDARLWNHLVQLVCDLANIFDSVMNEENLSFAEDFPPNRLRYGPVVILANMGKDRQSFSRGCM
jgi:hypothetical protein